MSLNVMFYYLLQRKNNILSDNNKIQLLMQQKSGKHYKCLNCLSRYRRYLLTQ